jgi:hypothetical protein
LWFFSGPTGKFWDTTLKSGMTISFRILSYSLTNYTTNRRYVTKLKMSLNQSVNQVESITDFSSETEDEVQRYSAVSAAVAGR